MTSMDSIQVLAAITMIRLSNIYLIIIKLLFSHKFTGTRNSRPVPLGEMHPLYYTKQLKLNMVL